jgi:hypothetical protein
MTTSFSELADLDYLGWVYSDTPKHIVLNLYSGTADRSAIHNVFVYLVSAHIAGADVKCDPFFPAVVKIEEVTFPENPEGFRKWAKFHFEQGSISFFYEQMSFQREFRELPR